MSSWDPGILGTEHASFWVFARIHIEGSWVWLALAGIVKRVSRVMCPLFTSVTKVTFVHFALFFRQGVTM